MIRHHRPVLTRSNHRQLVPLLAAILLTAACGSSSGPDAAAEPTGAAVTRATVTGAPRPSAQASTGPTLSAPASTVGATGGPQAPRPDPDATAPASSAPIQPSSLPTPQATAAPSPAPVALDPAPKAGRFQIDLFQPQAFVAQYTPDWCVPASMQMMANLIAPDRIDRSRETQRKLYVLARQISPWTETGPGAAIVGWTVGLEQLGYGRFLELADPSMREALRIMARQIRFTNKPAGLWVWDGDHAWVVSGFKSTGDPAYTDDFEVTAVWVEDPWSGRVSSTWGPGREPHTLLSTTQLRRAWTPFASIHRPQYGEDGMFVVIAPIA